jgi:hypothetical protein
MVLHARIPDREQLRAEARFQGMRAERPQRNAGRGEQRAQGDDELGAQDAFFDFFTRCGRFLP